MKPFLLFIAVISAISAFGQSQFYGTVSMGYPTMEHYTFNSMTVRSNISNIQLKPCFSFGVGRLFSINKRFDIDIALDVNNIRGTADYKDSYVWMTSSEGIFNYQFVRFRLSPMLDFKVTKALKISVGLLLIGDLSTHQYDGTKTINGEYTDGNWIPYSPPIQQSTKQTYVSLPNFSGGFSGSLEYVIKDRFGIFSRYTFDNGLTLGGSVFDFLRIQTFSVGINYYFKSKNQ